jgi:hypothetical protein
LKIRLQALLLAGCAAVWGQSVHLDPAPRHALPTHVDGNTSSFWADGVLHLFTSTGDPLMISRGPDQFGPFESAPVDVSRQEHRPLWVEAAWRDEDGTIYGWYHHEPGEVCPGKPGLTAPKIGAVVSFDNGASVIDLGIVLESGEAPDCNAKNGFFASGHGDFSVVLDRGKQYFYFLFTNYGGDVREQGIVIARLAFEDRMRPVGAVRKYYRGEWEEPGIGGRMTPIFAASRAWQSEDTDSYWGPSIHWNTALERYVVLMNRSCCAPGWPQEGIYLAATYDLADPTYWSRATKILDGASIPEHPGYYPQVMGLEAGGTDTEAGLVSRLYIMGVSHWYLRFAYAEATPPEEPYDGTTTVGPQALLGGPQVGLNNRLHFRPKPQVNTNRRVRR